MNTRTAKCTAHGPLQHTSSVHQGDTQPFYEA